MFWGSEELSSIDIELKNIEHALNTKDTAVLFPIDLSQYIKNDNIKRLIKNIQLIIHIDEGIGVLSFTQKQKLENLVTTLLCCERKNVNNILTHMQAFIKENQHTPDMTFLLTDFIHEALHQKKHDLQQRRAKAQHQTIGLTNRPFPTHVETPPNPSTRISKKKRPP